jgi:hypothetical protein
MFLYIATIHHNYGVVGYKSLSTVHTAENGVRAGIGNDRRVGLTAPPNGDPGGSGDACDGDSSD